MTHSTGPAAQLTRGEPAPRRLWDQLVAADADALPTQSPGWLDALCADGRYVDASACYELSDGRRALLPLVRRAHRPEWASTLGSMPASWGFGGLVVEGGVTADAVTSVVDDLVSRGALRVRLRPNPLHADAWAVATAGRRGVATTPSCAHVLDLRGGFTTVWEQRFRSSTRSHVRKAERMGVVVETDTTGRLLPELHALLRMSVDRWAEHQHEPARLAQARFERRDPLTKLQSIAAHLGGSCRVSVARFEGAPVAAILVLQGRNAHYTRGAMDEELASHTQANKLLHSVAIEAACRAGCRSYHMGESGASPGLAQFKSRFGAVAHPYQEYFIERAPLTRLDRLARTSAKRVLGFRDV
jgi:Acetyltransferase (GNAT) domain